MIRDISKQSVNHSLGPVSISVDEILGILESKHPVEVTAENNSIEFSSIDDIRSHKKLFAGRPRIRVDGVNISFDRAFPRVTYYGGSESGASLAKSIHLEIMSHANSMDKFSNLRIFSSFIGTAILMLLVAPGYFLKQYGIENIFIIVFDVVSSVYIITYLVVQIWRGYSTFIRKSVYYNPRASFWSRNKDAIWLSAITGVIGVVIGALGSKLADKLATLF